MDRGPVTSSFMNYDSSIYNSYEKHQLSLEGECKIQNTELLQYSIKKTICAILIIIPLNIIALLCLKHSKTLRKNAFYNLSNTENATHIFIKGNGKKQQQIVQIIKIDHHIYFYYRKLKYQLINNKAFPVCLFYQQQLDEKFKSEFMKKGLSKEEVKERRELYGKNQHIVEAPHYFEYIYDVLTEPTFIIQYLAAFIYIIERIIQIAIILLVSSFITTSINYILLYISYKRIKEIAGKVVEVKVLRNGEFTVIPSNQLVQGDLIALEKEICCDVVLLEGEIYVNQSNLTGQSIPIGKFPLLNLKNWQTNDTSMWLYQGSNVLSSSANSLGMVINTGYGTKRGRILRKILNKNSNTPQFFKTFIYFLIEMYIVGVIIYLATLSMRIQNGNLDPIIIFFNFLLIITFCFPPGFPIYFNLLYSFCLIRLKNKNILGIDPEKTVESAHLKIMCFDKTGTLTEDTVELHKVFTFVSEGFKDITAVSNQSVSSLFDYKIFSCCHSVKFFENKLMGDEIDLKMFLHSHYKLTSQLNGQEGVKFEVQTNETIKYNKLRVLKIFQYQSKFQSMSVLVYDYDSNKYYIFAKGAPEMIHKISKVKYSYFDNLLKNVSYGGYRSIAYGYKEVELIDKNAMLQQTRDAYLKDLNILGLLVFQNKLKEDSKKTIQLLKQANIDSKIITGDNIYIAIETGIRCEILNRDQQIYVFEGRQQPDFDQEIIFKAKVFQFQNEQSNIFDRDISYEEYLLSQKSMVVDNQFFKHIKHLKLSANIKIYARISPENKANIVKKLKNQKIKEKKKLPKLQRMLKEQIDKIGMVGDGANDLLAIKQADIGIGIKNCDSSYAASFSIEKLLDIDEIVRQSKCTELQIIEVCRFLAVSGFLNLIQIIIFETQASYFHEFQLMILAISKSIPFPILLGISRPSPNPTVYKPCSNFLKIQNQLFTWGNIIISGLTYLAIMLYIHTVPEYVRNETRATFDSGWVSQTQLVTGQFLFAMLQPVGLVFFVYQSSPWKECFCQNILLFIFFALNFLTSIALFFVTQQLKSAFKFVDLSYKTVGYIFLISMVSTIICLIYSAWLAFMRFHVREYESKSQNNLSIKRQSQQKTSSSNTNTQL